MSVAALPALIQRFFTDRLCVQMEASRHTVAGYRDTFRLLLRYASVRHGKPPVKLTIEDIDADLVADVLVHTETARGNGARSRNTRLAAIRSFFRYVAMSDPTRLLHCQRILAMPNKRYVKRTVTFLDSDEIAALLAAPNRTTWAGRRDHALLLLAVMAALIFADVFCRYALHFSIAWADEITLIFLIWYVFIALAIGVRRRAHASIDLITIFIPNRCLDRFAHWVVSILTFTFGGLLVYFGMELIKIGSFSTLASVDLPSYWEYVFIPVSGVLVMYTAITNHFLDRSVDPPADLLDDVFMKKADRHV